LNVIGKTTLEIKARQRRVWEIAGSTGSLECETAEGPSGSSTGYNERWWYSPEINAVVQYETRTLWQHQTYTLKSIKGPVKRL
jgi:hypothetical protein